MALPLHPSANLDTTPLPSQTNTEAGINISKRPRLVDNITAEYLQHQQAQQEAFYEHGFTVETQLQHHQDQLQQPDWAALQFQLDAQPQEQEQFQQLQQLQHSQHSEDILADGAGFLSFYYPNLPEQTSEEAQFISSHLSHQHLHHPEEQLPPPSPALVFDPSLAFLHGPIPMSSLVALPPGPFNQHPSAELMPPPPPPPPPPPAAKPHANTPRPRAPMTSTSVTAAAALSSSSASAAFAYASSSSATGPSACTLRIGGYTLEEAGIKLPNGLTDAERRRRLRIIAEELHHEATHPPVLPPSQVPDLPEKPPPVPLPKMTPGMTQAQREATNAEILRLSQAQKKADQSRNNLAAKKSRMLRLECLDNTRLQLDAKSAECIWLRVQIVALAGEPLPRRPSEAWGGFDYVYRARKRRRQRLMTLLEDESGAPGGGPPIKVEEQMEEEEEEEEPDVEGIVPRRVKEAITEEVRARVEAHKDAVEEDSKRKTSASRTAKKSEAAKAEAAKAEAAAKADKAGRQRRGSGGGKRKQ